MAKFYSKYRSYGITLPDNKKIKFNDHYYETANEVEAEALRKSPANGVDYNELDADKTKKK